MSTLVENVHSLEARATEAEKNIANLKKQLESGPGAHVEDRLRELLKLMTEDRDECEVIRAQRDDLQQENERLRTQISKHEYRIKHLLRTIDEIEGNTKDK